MVMKKTATVAKTAAMADVQERFAAWRNGDNKGRRIPEVLWDAAAKLAREIGVNPVSRALSLDYPRLKRRAANVGHVDQTSPLPSDASFVELAMESIPQMSECTFEYEGRHGKLTIRLNGHDQSQVMTLVDRLAEAAR